MDHCKKRFTSFPSPAGMSQTKLRLGRNNSVMTSLFPPRESLVVTSRLGTGNSRTFFYGVWSIGQSCKQRRSVISRGTIPNHSDRFFLFNSPLLWPHNPPSPLTHSIRNTYVPYRILIHAEKGGGGRANQGEGYRAMLHKAGRTYLHDWLHLQSINSTKHIRMYSMPILTGKAGKERANQRED
jgi:hypothetical protein